jgi:hypothetical protein
MNTLRKLIRQILREVKHPAVEEKGEDHMTDDLLTEPDDVDDISAQKKEQSVVASIAGVTTPLGTGPTYPKHSKSKKKSKKKSSTGDTSWYKLSQS